MQFYRKNERNQVEERLQRGDMEQLVDWKGRRSTGGKASASRFEWLRSNVSNSGGEGVDDGSDSSNAVWFKDGGRGEKMDSTEEECIRETW